jgi:SAM-dependent methyltransferase
MTKQFGLGRGMVFPAKRARSLLNPLRRLIQSPTRTVQRMALVRTDRVLEIGCGPGYFSRAIALAVPEGSLVLFDLQEAMLEPLGKGCRTLRTFSLRKATPCHCRSQTAHSMPYCSFSYSAKCQTETVALPR